MDSIMQESPRVSPAFWGSYLEGVSCTFPTLADNDSTPEAQNNTRPRNRTLISCLPAGAVPPEKEGKLCRPGDNASPSPSYIHLAAWAVLLSRYSGTGQVCFGTFEGTPESSDGGNATRKFSVCRVHVSREESAAAAILACRESVEACRPNTCRSAAELFRLIEADEQQRLFNTAVVYNCHRAPEGPTCDKDMPPEASEFDIELRLDRKGGDLEACLEYSPTILSDTAAALIADAYQTIFTELAKSPDSPLNQLNLMGQEDMTRVSTWNESVPEATNCLLQDALYRNVCSNPHAPALVASDASFTYQELDDTANILAHYLVNTQRVGPEVVVPLCFDKSAFAVVAMLAVAKAGGAFTFLDASYPTERLHAIIEQVDAKILLSSASTMDMCRELMPAFEVSSNTLASLPPTSTSAPPQTPVTPSNLLYIIFTSGSTGRPKGVCIEHGNYLSCAAAQAWACGMSPSSRVLQFASFSFDASILETLTPLVTGACVCIPDENARGRGIASVINELGVTWAFLTPSLAKLIGPSDVPQLETLALGGEALAPSDVRTWTAGGRVRLVNAYGPTECSIVSAVHPGLTPETSANNIGWAVGGLLWVVDADDYHQLVPIGGIGELAVEGPHLGRGYLNEPEKTAAAFIESPQWMAGLSRPSPARTTNPRIYLTGDLVRRHPDGSVRFVGRKDTQVKIRGLRIELGDIEHHLSINPLVHDAAVIVPASGVRRKQLVAVVTLPVAGGEEKKRRPMEIMKSDSEEGEHVRTAVRKIRAYLEEKVPNYMVPSTWFVLEVFPLTPSAKVDRRKVRRWLEEMDARTLGESECLLDDMVAVGDSININIKTTESTGGQTEETLRAVVGHVLNLPLESVAPSRSFVNLGGDSISAMQLMSRCKLQGLTVRVKDILRCKSISELAGCAELIVGEIRGEGGNQGLRGGEEKYDVPFALSPIQQLYFQLEPRGTRPGGDNRFNQSFLLRLNQRKPFHAIKAALTALVERHAMLRCRFVSPAAGGTDGPRQWQQLFPSVVDSSFKIQEHWASSSREQAQNIIHRSQCEMDMIRGPVFVADLINQGRERQLLSMIAHHAVIDLVSWRIIMQELEELLLQGGLAASQRPFSWQAWCRLQTDYAQSHLHPSVAFPNEIEPANLAYWGMDGGQPKNTIGDATKIVFKLDAAATSRLTSPECHRFLRTEPIDIFLSAIIHSFGLVFTDRKTPTIFRESHGRESWDDNIDISSTVGWFTSIFPVYVEKQTQVQGGGDHWQLIDTIRRVKDTQRRVPRNGWPYFASRYNHPDGIAQFGPAWETVEMQFDYLGLYQQLERQGALFTQEVWPDAAADDVGPGFNRLALFEITAEIIRGEFKLTFEFNAGMDHQPQIRRWIWECEMVLRRVPDELALLEDSPRFTLHDFPLLKTNYRGLDALMDSTLTRLGVSPEDVEDVYGTSPMQTGLLLSQARDDSLYRYFVVFRVEATSAFESVDVPRLMDAWRAVVRRHSALRSIFVPGDVSDDDGATFTQVVLKNADIRTAHVRCGNPSEAQDILQSHTTDISLQDALPPHKFTVCEVDTGGEVFLRIDINHALVDGSSVEILAGDFLAAYNDNNNTNYNHQGPLSPISPYSKFMAHLQTCDVDAELRYWASYLEGVEPCYLPVLDDGLAQDGSLQTLTVDLGDLLPTASLHGFTRAHNVTLPTLFKVVWALVLRAYTGSDNVCFGYLVSGRDVPIEDINDMVGAFINILVCRVDFASSNSTPNTISDDGTLMALLGKVHDDALQDRQYEHCSLAHVRRQGPVDADLAARPLFNTALNFQIQQKKEDIKQQTSNGVESPIELKTEHIYDPTEFSVALDIALIDERLEINLNYRTSSVCTRQAQNIGEALKAALSLLVRPRNSSDPLALRDLDVFADRHREQIFSWNARLPAKVDMCIHDIIARQVLARPGATAVEAWDASLSYERLAALSAQLRAHLVHHGVGKGVIVPLCFEKSARTVVAVMAVMQAGGTFVFLDPKQVRSERTRGILHDTGARVLITDSEDLLSEDGIIVDGREVDVLVYSKDREDTIRSCRTCRLQDKKQQYPKPQPSDPAYIIFTSGTTGTPKGSVTSHSAFATSAACHGRISRMSPSSRVLQYASYTFDACLLEILTTLMFGGCVCVPTEQQRMDDVAGFMGDTRVTLAVITPSVSRLIRPDDVPALRTLVLCGEAMSSADIARWRGRVSLHNGYGPSECSVACAWNDAVRDDPANIGRSLSGVCWIVDPADHGRLVPIGAVGELVVEGFTVADGYLHNEAKTAEVFVEPPSWMMDMRRQSSRGASPPRRLYKTGDLVRYNSDGSMVFIGRKDTQVKFHGQRIEVGEIEHHIVSRSDVINGVVVEVIRPEARQGKQTLVAFFTTAHYHAERKTSGDLFCPLSDEIAAQIQALQNGLTEVIPAYMVPSAFIHVASLPRTASGKLDRKTLAKSAEALGAQLLNRYSLLGATKNRELTSETERRLRTAWAETLGASTEGSIGSETSFFRIGGDSLAAMSLVTKARSLGLVLTVADIFNHPKLSDMAKVAEAINNRTTRTDAQQAAVEPFSLFEGDENLIRDLVAVAAEQCDVSRDLVTDLYPCTPLQEGLMALAMEKPGAYLGQMACRIPDDSSVIDIDRFQQAWKQVVVANPILRTRIVNIKSTGNLQAVLNLPITWSSCRCTSVQQYLKDDLLTPITWGAPLCRFAVVTTTAPGQERYFVWSAHHALFDGWSQSLAFEQLEQTYYGIEMTETAPFNSFIAFLANSDNGACADFWTAYLDGDTPSSLPRLPSDDYIPTADHYHERTITLPKRHNSQSADILTSTILRAAWALVTARYSDAEDVIFGTTLSGRNAPVADIARINGPTITTVPVRVHIDRDQAISDFLEGLQAQANAAIPFEHWGLHNISQVAKNSKFHNLLVVQPASEGGDKQRGPLGLETVEVDESGFNTYALTIECLLTGDADVIRLKMSYDAEVTPYAPRLGNHFGHLIRQLVRRADDASPLSSLQFCTEEDKAQVFAWNEEEPLHITDKCIHDLVSERGRAGTGDPDALAVCSWDLDLTYGELDVVSTRLAQHLARLGVRAGTIVPAVFEKTAWTVVAQMAILKAGGALCMLDPTTPMARLEAIIGTVEADIVLASEMHADLLRGKVGAIVTVGEATMDRIKREDSPPTSLPRISPDTAAYIVFTSGTSGKPKGSVTNHAAFVSKSAAMALATHISACSRVLQYASFAFDAFILETLTPLIEGGCVCIVKEEARTSPDELVETIHAYGVTWAILTPSVARLLPRDRVPSLRTLCLGGEGMWRSDKAWSETVMLMNAYGPSESTVMSTVNPDVTSDSDHTTIGRGVGTRCWIVEPGDHDSLAPVGCTGELLVESPGLARGYLKEPRKTAEVFIGSPRWLRAVRPGSRLYKTGDLVRYNADGSIRFVGRKDLQVKLHGQRMELGDIEHHLAGSPLVEAVSVCLPKTGPFTGKLVATLTLKPLSSSASPSRPGDAELTLVDTGSRPAAVRQVAEIRAYLESQAPSYMVPSVWTVVYALPLSASLKINKNKIAAWLETMGEEASREVMGLQDAADDEPVREACTAMERQLQGVVARVLNIPADQALLNRSFIALGGDSITAMQIVARCRAEKVGVNIKDVMHAKSLVKLAERATPMADGSGGEVFEKESFGTRFPLSPIQRLYFEAGLGQSTQTRSSLDSEHFNQSVLVRLRRRVTVDQLRGGIEAIVRQHSMLRAQFSRVEGTWMQVVHPSEAAERSYVFEHHTLAREEEMLPEMALSQRRLDAEMGLVFSADSFEVVGSHGHHLLFLAAHHLVIDLVSWRIILQDLEEFINTGGQLFSKAPLPFQTWLRLQENYAAQHIRARELEAHFRLPHEDGSMTSDYRYWGIQPSTNIFGDSVTSTFTLDVASTAALLGGSCNDSLGTETMDLFISCLLESFSGVFTDRGIPPVYCEGHGREPWDNRMDLSSTVGWFTTIYPVFVPLVQGTGLIDAVRRTKDARRRIPSNGWSYFASRYLTEEGHAAFSDHWPMEIAFNYAGQYQQLEREDSLLLEMPLPLPDDGSMPPFADVGARCRRLALFDVSAQITNGQASFSFVSNRHSLHGDKIRRWISAYRDSLQLAVDLLPSLPVTRTISDFPLITLSYSDIERIAGTTLPSLGLTDGFDGVEDIYACAPTQKGILMSQARSDAAYRNSFLCSVSSSRSGQPVDLQRLMAAWQVVVARHSALRTVIVDDLSGGEAYVQLVLASWFPRMLHFDCMTVETGDDDDEEAVVVAEMRRMIPPIDHDRHRAEPPHRMLFCRAGARVYMNLEISHAFIDGFSLGPLFRDIVLAYEGRLQLGNEASPPSYRGYVAHIRGLNMDDSMAYWTEYLRDVQPCCVPVLQEGTSPDVQEIRSVPLTLGTARSARITSFSRAQGVTPANVFQVAWAMVLRLYTGMGRVCFGYLTSGRDVPVEDVEDIVGALCNMLVFKLDLQGGWSRHQLLQDARDGWAGSIQHQFVSLADIQHHQGGGGGPSGQALFNTGMSYRSTANNARGKRQGEDDGASIALNLITGEDPSEYDITINISADQDTGFSALFNYRVSHMTEVQAEAMVRTLHRAIDSLVMSGEDAGDIGDGGVPEPWGLVSEEDSILLDHNKTPSLAPEMPSLLRAESDTCIDHLISRHAQTSPESPAICSWDGQLTYRELDALSSRLAGELMSSHGVGPEVLVPVCMEKSVWFVVSVLAILKTGGAFVPMDSTQAGRFETIIRQTGAKVVLTSAGQTGGISKLVETALVVDGNHMPPVKTHGDHPSTILPPRDSSSAAYVLFTSGSTGVPKGVVVEHRAWCASAAGQGEAWGINAQTRMLQFASYGFDASLGEVLTPLMAGGCVCVPSEAERLDGIEAAINRMGVNVTIFSPSFIKVLSPERIPLVHTMILGGESTPEAEIRRWGGRVRLIPAYGPTECSLVSSSVAGLTLDVKPSNIGAPNTSRYWVVDPADHDILLPVGGIGELLIEGPILARGYLRQPDKTASAFITNPKWAALPRTGEARRMYKTGDLAQVNPDGSYRYLGRKDTQVKVRGQRIELGEVEHHLQAAIGGGYTVAVEVLKSGNNGHAELVGFVALGDEYDGDSVDLAAFSSSSSFSSEGSISHLTIARLQDIVAGVSGKMAKTVPSYMIPTAFIPLRAIPLSPSCKTDRKRLREIAASISRADLAMLSEAEHRRGELTDLEHRMRGLWAAVLNPEPDLIGPASTFFAVGGDSVLAIKLVAACRSAGLVVSVADILRNPSLEDLCRSLGAAMNNNGNGTGTNNNTKKIYEPLESLGCLKDSDFVEQIVCPQVGTDPGNVENVLEATSLQSNFITSGLMKSRGHTNYLAFQFTGAIDAATLETACRRLMARHPILRTSFIAFKRRVFQVVLRSMATAEFRNFPCAKWRQPYLASKLVKSDQAEPVVLGQPLVRFLFLQGDRQSMLVMRVSHAQYDGLSVPVLIDDLSAFYDGLEGPERPTFADFVHAAREQNEHQGAAEDYWYGLLEGSRMTNVISHKTPPYRNAKLRSVSREIPMPLQGQPSSSSSPGGVTFATILKAAWALVLAEMSSSTDVVFGHLISGRNLAIPGTDVSEVLGPCLNFIPVRVRLQLGSNAAAEGQQQDDKKRLTAGDVLRQVYEQQLAAIPFETMGLDRIVERCTDWPLWTRFSTVVQHQNLGGVEDVLQHQFRFSSSGSCRVGGFQGRHDSVDIHVLSTPKSAGAKVEVKLLFSDKALSPDLVADMLDRLLAHIDLLASASLSGAGDGDVPLSDVVRRWTGAPPQIPVLARSILGPNGNVIPTSFTSGVDRTLAAVAAGYRPEDVPPVVRDLVGQAWRCILLDDLPPDQVVAAYNYNDDEDYDDAAAAAMVTPTTCFYNVWGNLIAAQQFAEFYTDALGGEKTTPQVVTVEDMIDSPSMLAQGLLLAERLGLAVKPTDAGSACSSSPAAGLRKTARSGGRVRFGGGTRQARVVTHAAEATEKKESRGKDQKAKGPRIMGLWREMKTRGNSKNGAGRKMVAAAV